MRSAAFGTSCPRPAARSRRARRTRAVEAAVGTSATARVSWPRTGSDAVLAAAYGLGAVALAGEAAAHVQQYATVVHGVRWIGPLFLINAVASVVAIAGLTYERTRQLAALAGIVISVLALGALVVSYGNGLFGYHEGGFRTA